MSYETTLVDLVADSGQFQLLMDRSAEVFDQPIWGNYLTDKFQLSLDWKSVLGVMETSPMASVIDFSSGKPIYVRPTVSKLTGEIPTLGMKYQMDKQEVRNLLDLQDQVGNLGISATDLIDFIIPDLKRATLGPHATVDRLFLEAISTSLMTMTATNNPKGVIWNSALDWGITKKYTSVIWSTGNAATMKPITDIKKVVDDWEAATGQRFNIVKMSRTTFNLMVASTEFKNAFTATIGLSGLNKIDSVNNAFLTPSIVNQTMNALGLPTIELIDKSFAIENKDDSVTTLKPFADNRLSFSVDNDYGQLIRSYANEERRPIAGKSYAKAMNVLISKYQNNDGSEFTESEFNAFPVLNKVKQMAIFVTDATSA